MKRNLEPRIVRNGTTLRYVDAEGRTRDRRVPPGTDPLDYLKAFSQTPEPEPESLYTVLDSMLEHYRSQTRKPYRCYLRIARTWNPSGLWSPRVTVEFVAALRSSGRYRETTIQAILAALRSLWDSAYTVERVQGSNPFRVKVRWNPEAKTRFLPVTQADYNRVKAALADDPEALILIDMVTTGMIRPKEVDGLRPENVDCETNTVTVPAEVAKTRELRTVVLPATARVGCLYGKVAAIRRRVHAAMRAVGLAVGRVSLYSFKHLGATTLYLATGDVYVVRRQAGHKSVNATERYLQGAATVPEVVRQGWLD